MEPIIIDEDDNDKEEEDTSLSSSSCSICSLSCGRTVRCAETGCPKRVHAMCARVAGCTMMTQENVRTGGVDFLAFCRDHGSLTSCKVCKRSDRPDAMLLCDGCDAEYHMDCLTPPLKSLPEHSWYCPTCAPVIAKQRDGKLYCICKQPAGDLNADVKYVQCEKCEDWFHFGCVGISEAPNEAWFCHGCSV